MPRMDSQIVIERVSHVYRPPRGRAVPALEDVSLEVGRREFIALLGPSGCGKSTLLYLLGGFLPTENGAILVNGKPITGPGPDRGIVFQHFALFPWKTVRRTSSTASRSSACRATSDCGRRRPSSTWSG